MSGYRGRDGSSGKPLPDGYEWRKDSASGDLQLWKTDASPNILITSQNIGKFDVNGSLRANINTVYLEQAHAITSAGEEITFNNLETGGYFTPVWGFSGEDGAIVRKAAALEEGALVGLDINGTPHASMQVPCVIDYPIAYNRTIYSYTVKSAEAYSGKLSIVVLNSLGDGVFAAELDFSVSLGGDVVFDKLLYRVRVGNVRTVKILKEDGSPLNVYAGDIATSEPYAHITCRDFVDREIVTVGTDGKVPLDKLPNIDTVDRVVVANQAARLALTQTSKFVIAIQSDVQRQYYLEGGFDPSVLANWVDGGSTASSVTAFNGRTGAVTPQSGDYTAAQVGAVAVPANDGVRRVFIGSTPIQENIIDNLTSTSTSSPLSAAQGKALKDSMDGVTSSIQTQLNNKADKTHIKSGYDLVVNTQPQFVFRDKFLTSGLASATISAANVPWVYANIDAAESSLPYWIQELTTFFKNLENDNQFDQLIGGIPANFSIPRGSWGVAPSVGTDMDNSTGSTTTYSFESFELIVGKNSAETEVYTFGFTFALFANATYITYQTTRGASSGFDGYLITPIIYTTPRCTARSSSFTVGGYLSTAFPLMFEPITLEIKR